MIMAHQHAILGGGRGPYQNFLKVNDSAVLVGDMRQLAHCFLLS